MEVAGEECRCHLLEHTHRLLRRRRPHPLRPRHHPLRPKLHLHLLLCHLMLLLRRDEPDLVGWWRRRHLAAVGGNLAAPCAELRDGVGVAALHLPPAGA